MSGCQFDINSQLFLCNYENKQQKYYATKSIFLHRKHFGALSKMKASARQKALSIT